MKAKEIRLVRGRLKFEQEGKDNSAPFPSAIVVFDGYDHIPQFFPADKLGRKILVVEDN